MRGRGSRCLAVATGMVAMLMAVAAPAQATASDPLFVFTPLSMPLPGFPPPPLLPPPAGLLEGPCGLGVGPNGNFYVSDYYHDAVDVYDQNANYNASGVTGATGYLTQYAGIDPEDGPCGLALDASSHLYLNDYHRAVIRYPGATTISGATAPDETHPTGVAVDPATGRVYVDERTYVAAFEESGSPVMTGPPGSEVPLHIGEGSLQDGYGIAFSSYPGTEGHLYVPDAATNTVKVYDSATPAAGPVEVLGGSNTPNGEFVSLRDSAMAVDRVTGEVYLLDDLQPTYTERPQAIVYVFSAARAYEGHLKYLVTDGWPSGLAVDDSATASQGRVYLTSGNTAFGSIYAYGPGAATTAPFKLSTASLSLTATGTGAGAIQSSFGAGGCTSACEEEVPAGSSVTLSAQPAQGSEFEGWSGACSGAAPSCQLTAEESSAVAARFAPVGEEGAQSTEATNGPQGQETASALPPLPSQTTRFTRRHHKHHHHHHHHHHRHHRKGHQR